jgi:hypothetical protein
MMRSEKTGLTCRTGVIVRVTHGSIHERKPVTANGRRRRARPASSEPSGLISPRRVPSSTHPPFPLKRSSSSRSLSQPHVARSSPVATWRRRHQVVLYGQDRGGRALDQPQDAEPPPARGSAECPQRPGCVVHRELAKGSLVASLPRAWLTWLSVLPLRTSPPVRLLREELQLLQEPGSYVGEVVKVMGKTKVLVKVQPEGKYGALSTSTCARRVLPETCLKRLTLAVHRDQSSTSRPTSTSRP